MSKIFISLTRTYYSTSSYKWETKRVLIPISHISKIEESSKGSVVYTCLPGSKMSESVDVTETIDEIEIKLSHANN